MAVSCSAVGKIHCPPSSSGDSATKGWYTGTMSASGMPADSAAFTAKVMMLSLHPFNSLRHGYGSRP